MQTYAQRLGKGFRGAVHKPHTSPLKEGASHFSSSKLGCSVRQRHQTISPNELLCRHREWSAPRQKKHSFSPLVLTAADFNRAVAETPTTGQRAPPYLQCPAFSGWFCQVRQPSKERCDIAENRSTSRPQRYLSIHVSYEVFTQYRRVPYYQT